MQRQIPPRRTFSCTPPTLAHNLAALNVTCNLRKWKPLLVRGRFGRKDDGPVAHSSPILACVGMFRSTQLCHPDRNRSLQSDDLWSGGIGVSGGAEGAPFQISRSLRNLEWDVGGWHTMQQA